MAVDNRQTVGITHRQRGDGSVRLRYSQVLCDGIGVVIDVFIRLPNQHRTPRAS